ncbi:MAG: uracil-DNA glycosylase [Sphingomonadales bacterium]
MTLPDPGSNDDLSNLAWQVESGANEAILDNPVNRFLIKEKEKSEPRQGLPEKPQKPAPDLPLAPSMTLAPGEAAISAENLAKSAKTLGELKAAIEGFEGCSLKKTAMNTVFARGEVASGLMLIGEAPGAEEDRQGKPFVGASGHLLDTMMAAIGRKKDKDFYISNILPWRPPGNRKPTPVEQTLCLPFIKRHIELVSPRVIILLGGTALSALLDISEGITRVRGKWFSYPVGKAKIPAMAMFHPAYLLRQPQLKRQAWHDLLEIKTKLDG